MAQRRERERLYLAALGDMTAAAGKNGTEYMNLRALVNDAEIELKLVGAEISQHQDRHALPN